MLIRKPFIGEHLWLELFWSWKQWDLQKELILINVAVFIPVGIITGRLWEWKGFLATVGFSIAIEVIQLITARGLCEFDDVLHNTIGAFIGVGIVMMARARKRLR